MSRLIIDSPNGVGGKKNLSITRRKTRVGGSKPVMVQPAGQVGALTLLPDAFQTAVPVLVPHFYTDKPVGLDADAEPSPHLFRLFAHESSDHPQTV